MTTAALRSSAGRLPSRALVAYVLITFALTWGLIGLYIVFPQAASAALGPISGTHPVFVLATWSPAVAAVAIVLYASGFAGLRAFLSRLLLWRCSAGWAAFVLVVTPLVFVAGSLMKGGPVLAPLPPEGVGPVLATLVFMLFLGPVEELGWRGLAQPLLQRHMAPIWAGLVIGVVWGVWHLPAFFLASTVFAGWSFWPFFLGNVVLAVLVTPLLNGTRGGLLWPMLFHWQLINPFWPDAQPYDTLILAGVAVVVVWWNRESLFARTGAPTEVVPRTVPAGASR